MKGILIQIATATLCGLSIYMVAFSNAWPSYTIKLLESDQSPLENKMTPHEKSIMGSIGMLGSIPGVMIANFLIDKFGPKRIALLCGLGNILAWSLITTASTVTRIIIGRFIIGLFCSMNLVNVIMFTSEISQMSLRGSMICIVNFMYNLGTLISYIEGWFCSYNIINYVCLIKGVVFTVLTLLTKDSPGYLLRKGKDKEALNSLKFYRGVSETNQKILDEYVYMKNQHKQNENEDFSQLDVEKEKLNAEETEIKSIAKQSSWNILRTSKSAQRALVIITAQIMLSVCMGMIVIQAYAGQFFVKAAPNISPDFCSVILAIVTAATTLVGVILTDLLPRRLLMISSSIASTLCMGAMASMLRWSWGPQWGIPLLMVLYCITYHAGVINIPFVQMGECFAPEIKTLGSAIILIFMNLSNFLMLLVFHPLEKVLHLDGVFLLFSIIGAATTIVSILFMRETRMLPFEDIRDMFEEGYLNKNRLKTTVIKNAEK